MKMLMVLMPLILLCACAGKPTMRLENVYECHNGPLRGLVDIMHRAHEHDKDMLILIASNDDDPRQYVSERYAFDLFTPEGLDAKKQAYIKKAKKTCGL